MDLQRQFDTKESEMKHKLKELERQDAEKAKLITNLTQQVQQLEISNTEVKEQMKAD